MSYRTLPRFVVFSGEWGALAREHDIFRQRGNPILKPEGLKGGAESRKLVRETVQPPSVQYRPDDSRQFVY